MRFVAGLASLVQPWSDLYAASVPVETGVTFLHFAGLLVAGGFALAFDRGALRATSADAAGRSVYLEELRAVHRPVLIGIGVVVLSGIAMLLADVEVLLVSWAFWLKMGFFVALLWNGVGLRRTERRIEAEGDASPAWRALRRGAVRSMSLWVATLLVGTLLPAVA